MSAAHTENHPRSIKCAHHANVKVEHDICAHHPWHLIADWAAMVRAYFAAVLGCLAPGLPRGLGPQETPVLRPGPELTYAYEWQGKSRRWQLVLTTPAFAPHIGTLRNNRGVAMSEDRRCPRWTLENRWRRTLAKFQNYARNISSVLGLPDERELRPCGNADPPPSYRDLSAPHPPHWGTLPQWGKDDRRADVCCYLPLPGGRGWPRRGRERGSELNYENSAGHAVRSRTCWLFRPRFVL